MAFAVQLKIAGENIQRRADEVLRVSALKLFSRVVLGTPVDTGRARGNWQLVTGLRSIEQIEREDKGGGETIAAAQADVSSAKFGDTVVIGNNLPYIRELEFGRSLQAPNGMARLAAQDWSNIVDETARELNAR